MVSRIRSVHSTESALDNNQLSIFFDPDGPLCSEFFATIAAKTSGRAFPSNHLIGVRLIEGSLAEIAREKGLVECAVGLGRTLTNLEIARTRGRIGLATQDPTEAALAAYLFSRHSVLRRYRFGPRRSYYRDRDCD